MKMDWFFGKPGNLHGAKNYRCWSSRRSRQFDQCDNSRVYSIGLEISPSIRQITPSVCQETLTICILICVCSAQLGAEAAHGAALRL